MREISEKMEVKHVNRTEKWELILLALYAEAIHCGSFAEVTAKTMEMGSGEFGWMLYQLQMRGLIEGCRFQPPSPAAPGCLMGVLRDGLMLTPQGFQTAEGMLRQDSAAARLRSVWTILRDAGCTLMASVVYGWLQ